MAKTLVVDDGDIPILVESLKQSLEEGNSKIMIGPSERHVVESLLEYIKEVGTE